MNNELQNTILGRNRPALRARGSGRRVFALIATTGLAVTGVPAVSAGAASADEPRHAPATVLVSACVDFFPIPDNTVLGTNFVRSAFTFTSLAVAGGGIVPFVNEGLDALGDVTHGLQFADGGLRVRAPAPADTVDITIAVFHPPQVGIRALDAAGLVVDSVSVPADNTRHTVTLDGGQDITRLRFTGGGEEAVIEEICTD